MIEFVIDGINPEPWTASTSATGRHGGKFVTRHFKDEKLATFQEAVRESLRVDYPKVVPMDGPVALRFQLWRQLGKGIHEADDTNLQKGLEDALQGVLIVNDRQVKQVHATLMEQSIETTPLIVIGIKRFGFSKTFSDSLAAYYRAMKPAPRTPVVVLGGRDVEGVF